MTTLSAETQANSPCAGAQKGGSFLSVISFIPFQADSILLAAPMMVLLFARLFWIDDLLSRPNKPIERGHALSGWDKEGHPICVEPDGALLGHYGRVPRGLKL